MKRYLAICICIFSVGTANAIPIQWSLNNVAFDDGTNVTGSYFYDADFNTWSSLDITVQDGALPAFTYNSINSHIGSDNESALGFLLSDNTLSRYINFNFLDAMTNSGGFIDLKLTTPNPNDWQAGSWECDNCTITRYVTSGFISSSNVPEPSMLALLSLGLVGIGFTRRKI